MATSFNVIFVLTLICFTFIFVLHLYFNFGRIISPISYSVFYSNIIQSDFSQILLSIFFLNSIFQGLIAKFNNQFIFKRNSTLVKINVIPSLFDKNALSRVYEVPLITVVSKLTNEDAPKLADIMKTLDGTVCTTWNEKCTHVTTIEAHLTEKV